MALKKKFARLARITGCIFLHPLFIAIAIFVSTLWYSVCFHQERRNLRWQSEIHADQSGYFVYLPCWFDNGFEAKKFTSGTDSLVGMGFVLDFEKNKVVTKYTTGPAMLMAPFYLENKVCGRLFNYDYAPFSLSNFILVDVAAAFYLALGVLMLLLLLRHYDIKPAIAAFVVLALVYFTNVFYYATISPGMPHIYAFFLFAAYLFFSRKFVSTGKAFHLLLLSLTGSLIVVTRPTDSFFLLSVFFMGQPLKSSLKSFCKPFHLAIIVATAIVIALPQLLYWKFISGKLIYYSYGEEGFDNLGAPKVAEFLFSPNNGLIAYNPVYLVLFLSLFLLAFRKNGYAIFFIFFNLLLLYLYSSWHHRTFGYGFGSRNFVEVYAGFAIPFSLLLSKYFRRRAVLKKLLVICICLGAGFVNIRTMVSFDYRYNGLLENDWDWDEYFYLLTQHSTFYKFDFEKGPDPLNRDEHFKTAQGNFARSGTGFAIIDSVDAVFNPISVKKELLPTVVKSATVIFYVYGDAELFEGDVAFSVDSAGKECYRDIHTFKGFPLAKGEWKYIEEKFWISERMPKGTVFNFYFSNTQKHSYKIDDLSIEFR